MERMATFFCPSPKIQISKIAVNEKNRSPFNSIGANMKLMPSSSQMVKSPFNPSAESKELLMPKSNPMKEPAKNEWKTPNRKTVKLLNGGFTFLIDDDNHYIDDDGDVFYTPNKKPDLFNDGLTFTIHKSGNKNRDCYAMSRAKHGYHCRDLMKTIDTEDEIVEYSD